MEDSVTITLERATLDDLFRLKATVAFAGIPQKQKSTGVAAINGVLQAARYEPTADVKASV